MSVADQDLSLMYPLPRSRVLRANGQKQKASKAILVIDPVPPKPTAETLNFRRQRACRREAIEIAAEGDPELSLLLRL
jgi:hypothetical protein